MTGTIVFSVCITTVGVLVLVLNHLSTKINMNRLSQAWKHAIDFQSEVTKRLDEQRKTFSDHQDQLLKWNDFLTRRRVESADREINEVQRYMEIVKQDLVTAVGHAAAEACGQVRGSDIIRATVDTGSHQKSDQQKK